MRTQSPLSAHIAGMTPTSPEDSRISAQKDLAARLGIEASSATYIARTIELAAEEAEPQIGILAAAYGLSRDDVREISTTFSRMEQAALAA